MWLTGTVGWPVCVDGEEERLRRRNGSTCIVQSGTTERTQMAVREVPK